MKLTSILLLGLSVLAMPASRATAQVQLGQLAQQSAETWLALIDSGKYAESWQEAAELFTGIIGMWANTKGLHCQTLRVRYEAGKASHPCTNAAHPFERET